jgi:hypothetical protein
MIGLLHQSSNTCTWVIDKSFLIYGAPKDHKILQLRYNVIIFVMSKLKIVSSYLLFVMSILISLCQNSEPLVHNSEDRCFIIRNVMSILRSKAIIIK